MKDFEEAAAQTAQRIMSARQSGGFVTDEVVQRWIENALIDAFVAGRTSVYQEEMLASIKKQ